jgi:hypothetical protein
MDLCLFIPSSPLHTSISVSIFPDPRSPGLAPSPPTNLRQANRNRGRPHSASAVSCSATSVFLSDHRSGSRGNLKRKRTGMEKNEKAGKWERYFAILRTGIRVAKSYPQTTLPGADLLTTYICSAGLHVQLSRRCFKNARRNLGICWLGLRRSRKGKR